MEIKIELTPTQKEKIQTLIEHARKDIDAAENGTYRIKYTKKEIDTKAITQTEAAIKLIQKILEL